MSAATGIWPAAPDRCLFLHHFALTRVTGVTVMLRELLPAIEALDIDVAELPLEHLAGASDMVARLSAAHEDVDCVVGVNLHIERGWECARAGFEWAADRGIPTFLYVHDYWPHHEPPVRHLHDRCGAVLIATTPVIAEALRSDGFTVVATSAAVSLGNIAGSEASWGPGRPRIGAAGRLVPRKRFDDVVRAVRDADLDSVAELNLRLLPSHTYSSRQDDEVLAGVRAAAGTDRSTAGWLRILRRADPVQDYSGFSSYVCASDYEGLSIVPIEAAYCGCPPIMSAIAAHEHIVDQCFPDLAHLLLYPIGDHRALGRHLRDEIRTGRRRAHLNERIGAVRATICEHWSMDSTARLFARLAGGTRATRAGQTASRWGGPA